MSAEGINADLKKVKTIKDWLIPKTLTELHSFHSLTSFYRRFIRGFSIIMAHITNYMRQCEFHWTLTASRALEEIKFEITEVYMLRQSDFSKVGI